MRMWGYRLVSGHKNKIKSNTFKTITAGFKVRILKSKVI